MNITMIPIICSDLTRKVKSSKSQTTSKKKKLDKNNFFLQFKGFKNLFFCFFKGFEGFTLAMK